MENDKQVFEHTNEKSPPSDETPVRALLFVARGRLE